MSNFITNLGNLTSKISIALGDINTRIAGLTAETGGFSPADSGLTSQTLAGAVLELKELIDNLDATYGTDTEIAAKIQAVTDAWSAADGDLTTLINMKLDASSYNAADILDKLKTVDGALSGLDADLLQGHTLQQILDADAAVQAAVDAETTARTAADDTLSTQINDEASARIAADSALQSEVDARILLTEKGVAGGVATLDAAGLVPASQLPSFVDDVVEALTFNMLPEVGEASKIYVTLDTSAIYRWSGSGYVEISATAGTVDAALKLVNARTISLSGDASGNASFDGSQNVTILVDVPDLDLKVNIASIVNGLTSTLTNVPLSAAQGKALKDLIDALAIADVAGLTDALGDRVLYADIVDTLTSTSTTVPLSANQGRVLKGLIDNLNLLMTSNDVTLDTLQELVDFIKVNRTTLDSLTIGSIAGLQTALDNLAGSVDDEATRAKAAEAANAQAVVDEASARAAADGNLTLLSTSIKSNLVNAINEVVGELDSAKTTLQDNITAEASARTTADSALSTRIDNEVSARTAADSTLQGNLDAEATARANADATLQADIDTRIPATEKGAANGVATLDAAGLVPASQLPSFVDDVVEGATLANLPTTGEKGKIYVALDTGNVYRWSGTTYIEISADAGTADAAIKLQTARTIALGGDVSGSVSFDGTQNVTLTATVADDSHNHVISNVDGLQGALDLKVSIASIVNGLTSTLTNVPLSAAQGKALKGLIDVINAKLASDDLSLDKMQEVVDYIKATRAQLNSLGIAGVAGLQTALDNLSTAISGESTRAKAAEATNASAIAAEEEARVLADNALQTVVNSKLDAANYNATDVLTKLKTVDGAGSGLDADLLDGQSGAYYRDWANVTNKPDPTITLAGDASGNVTLTDLASGTLTVTVKDDSHNHTIANVDGLQTALNAKVNIASIVDGLTSTATAVPLSANQGRVLKGLIDNISTLLTSNDTTLDQLQEVVDYIKLNRAELESLSVTNIAGLQGELDTLAGAIGDEESARINADSALQNDINTRISATEKGYAYGVATLDANGKLTAVQVPGNVSMDGHTHDDRYFTEAEANARYLGKTATAADSAKLGGYDAGVYQRTVTTAQKTNLPVGWYTIAVNSGSRAVARFGLKDINSSDHQSCIFYGSHHFGAHSEITVLHSGRYNGSPFRYIRIKEGSTYDGALLQVYIDDASNMVQALILEDNYQDAGWVAKDFIPDGSNPGGVSNFAALTNTAAQVDLDQTMDGGMSTTGEIYAGGKTVQQRLWHAGNFDPSTKSNVGHTHDDRYFTETEADARYLGKTAKAADANLLDGLDGTYYRNWANITNKPDPTITLAGDLTGAVTLTDLASGTLTATVKDDSHNHIIGNIDGLQTALNAKVNTSALGAAGGVATLDSSGQVPASQLPSFVDDVLEVASYASLPVTGEVSKIYVALDTNKIYRWSGTTYIEISADAGTADSAVKLQTARTISLAGDVSGSVSFDGTQNVTLTATVADDSHNHTIANVDGLQTALNAKLNTTSYTAADVLTKLKTVDGAGSGLDADLLDGQSGAYYRDWTNVTNKPDPVITLGGDLTGSVTLTDLGSGTLTATVKDDSHNHIIGNVDGLQDALNAKVAIASIVNNLISTATNVPLSAAQGKALKDLIDSLTIADVSGLQTALNGKLSTTGVAADSSKLGNVPAADYITIHDSIDLGEIS